MADIVPSTGYMMQLGDPSTGSFTFQIGTAAYTKLTRTDEWRWIAQDRINNDPQEQFVGKGSTTFVLEGVIFTSYNPGAGVPGSLTTAVGTKQLDVIRAIADSGLPQSLVDGRGNIFGKVVVVSIREEAEEMLVNGAPQKQVFSITLRSYGQRNAPVLSNLNPFVPSQTPDGVSQDFAALAKTNPYAAVVATSLENNGVNHDDAQAEGLATEAIQQQYSSTLNTGSATSLAVTLAKNYGLSGAGFANGMKYVADIASETGHSDGSSIIGTGIPDVNTVLENDLGMSSDSEGSAALAVLSVAPSSVSDRGVFMSNFASQLQDALNTSADALEGTGIVTNKDSMDTDTSKRFDNLMSQLSALKQSDPDKYQSIFPDGSNAELNSVVDAQTQGSLSSSEASITQSITAQ